MSEAAPWFLFARMAWRGLTGIDGRCLRVLLRRYAWQGWRSLRAHRQRQAADRWFPPFLMLALTDRCDLRCRGCWVATNRGRDLSRSAIERLILSGRRHGCRFFTLLGGEPLLHRDLWAIVEDHPDCYFQIITNGSAIDDAWARRCRRAGNVTPLLSIDDLRPQSVGRRPAVANARALAACAHLRHRGVFFGIATTVDAVNRASVLDDPFVQTVLATGAQYLWYYAYRPMGGADHDRYRLDEDGFRILRERLLRLRRRHPILIVDTYWDADGRAVCPAAEGLCAHIGPGGDLEICPPLSAATASVYARGQLDGRIAANRLLRDFPAFAKAHTQGCPILACPQALHTFLLDHGAADTSGRGALAELAVLTPAACHDLPGDPLPEHGPYRLFKRQLFFGMGGYG